MSALQVKIVPLLDELQLPILVGTLVYLETKLTYYNFNCRHYSRMCTYHHIMVCTYLICIIVEMTKVALIYLSNFVCMFLSLLMLAVYWSLGYKHVNEERIIIALKTLEFLFTAHCTSVSILNIVLSSC
jgi:hypothetical protein